MTIIHYNWPELKSKIDFLLNNYKENTKVFNKDLDEEEFKDTIVEMKDDLVGLIRDHIHKFIL